MPDKRHMSIRDHQNLSGVDPRIVKLIKRAHKTCSTPFDVVKGIDGSCTYHSGGLAVTLEPKFSIGDSQKEGYENILATVSSLAVGIKVSVHHMGGGTYVLDPQETQDKLKTGDDYHG